MGYSTDFTGELKFSKELKASELAEVKTFLGEDCRNHPEWESLHLTHIDLELLDDFTGLKWDGSEKTYDLVEKVNLIIKRMRKKYRDFSLYGEMSAQGEDFKDRWILRIVDGEAKRIEIKLNGDVITCPHCEEEFLLEDTE